MLFAGRYEVIGELGSGGMGQLLLARAPRGARVVIKTAHAREDDERLRDEARVGMRLIHPNIVETLDLIEHAGRPALVTAYVPGASLFDLRRRGALPPAVVCRIGRQIAEALDALHEAVDENGRPLQMLHRDVTPGNVLLGYDGAARLIDLGIARSLESRAERTESGAVRGTLRYLAPELFASGPHSVRSDLWSLGVVLFEALLGREATRGPMAAAVGKIVSGKIMEIEPSERAEPAVVRGVAQLLRMDPLARPARARDAAALFAMLEKQLAAGRDVADEGRRAVIAAIGPEPDQRRETSQEAVMRAKEMFFAEARLQTTGVAEVAAVVDGGRTAPERPASALLLEDELVEPAATIPESVQPGGMPSTERLPRTLTPNDALRAYARRLQDLESRGGPKGPRASRH
ncbi:MAG: serine/threonine protein kinase [Deltaproteobacteria bacterium]|nr:serine/threonine protein kinase [Deltaproteobacteria bacterium]